MTGLGLGLSLRIGNRPGATGPLPPDYTVSTDAEFVTANTNATAGQIIQLQDSGTFTNLTLTNATGVTVRGQTAQVPVLRSLTLNGCQNATVTGLKLQANSVPSLAPKLIDLRNNLNGLVIDNCYIRGGNPWNGYANFDVTTTDTGRMGTSGTFSASSPYTTDLWFGIGAGDGAFLPRGDITIQNCTILDIGNGIKFTRGPTTAGKITINGNKIGRCYQDLIAIITPSTAAECTGIEICGNEMFDAFSQPQDNGNPHSDVIQISVSTTYDFPFPNILIAGNIYWFSPGCRGQAQRIFTNGYEPGYPLLAPTVVDNVMMSRVTGKGVELYSSSGEGTAWGYVRRNIMLARPTENALIQNETATNGITGIGPSTVSSAGLAVGNSADYGNVPNYLAYNLTETATGYATDRVVGNITTGQGTTAAAYATWFDTDTTGEWNAIVDADTALTALTPKVAYANNRPMVAGETAAAFRSRWAVPANRPWASMPSWVEWIDLSGVTIGSVQTSEWAYVHAGASGAARAISITGGEYRIADDRVGTNATAWTSSAGNVTSGKFLQVRQTASASGSTATTVSVTIGSETVDWSVTTASAFAGPVVSIEGTTPDLFRVSGASNLGSDGTLATIALLGFKMSAAPAAERVLFSSTAGSARVRVSILATSGRIRVRVANSGNTYFTTLDTSVNVCDGAAHDILFSLDVSQATSGAGASCYVDGSSALTATTWAAGTIAYSTNLTSYQFGMPSTDTMEVSLFYLNTVARADLTNATVRAKFVADPAVIGLTGDQPTGAAPLVMLVGTAGQSGGWNDAAGINRGSGSKYIKVGSASATDVSGSPWS